MCRVLPVNEFRTCSLADYYLCIQMLLIVKINTLVDVLGCRILLFLLLARANEWKTSSMSQQLFFQGEGVIVGDEDVIMDIER